MKVIVIPDSYKGCLSSKAVGEAMIEGIKTVDLDYQVQQFLIADGGEGTVEAFVEARHGQYLTIKTVDCFLNPIDVIVGIIDHTKVVMEVANIVGLAKLKKEELNPWEATSYGVGIVIKELLKLGYRKIIIGLGGSCTNDGGMGMLQALGMIFKDKDGDILKYGAKELAKIVTIDDKLIDLHDAELVVASDVTNKLLGENGATLIYGPQKGADQKTLVQIEKGMENYARIMSKYGYHLDDIISGGAAGGLGAAILGVLKATCSSGIDMLLKTINFENELTNDCIVISGEGQSDAQSANGKVISGISKLTKKKHIPLFIISGALNEGYQRLYDLGVTKAYALMDIAKDKDDSFRNAEYLIKKITANLLLENNVISHDHN